MERERVFRITDTNGELYAVLFIHTFNIGPHQMSCVQLRLLSDLPKGYRAGCEFWHSFSKTFSDFIDANPEDIIYFCHRDTTRNLARLRMFKRHFDLYLQANVANIEYFVCRGTDADGERRHIMFGLNKSNSDFNALKSEIEENADKIVRWHVELQTAENSVLRA